MCKELTEKESQSCNGCGSSYWALWVFRIPRWVSRAFYRCCNRHDVRYQNLENKQEADDELYDCMYYNAYRSPWYQKYIKLTIADLCYWALCTSLSNKAYNNCKKE